MGVVPSKDPLQVTEVPVMDGAGLPGGVVAGIQIALEIQVQYRETVPAGRRVPVPLAFSRQVEILQGSKKLTDVGFFRVPIRPWMALYSSEIFWNA